ncbi:MAG: hypothetical protein DMF76_20870 [Acidobacteria bacterium]|nr:MAG: hypothetical protein DMF76_20870 [Acidobacteriota bacterium]
MPTTLADIARELGVSKMTVSRAINNHPEISPETRARILEAAQRMNYRPNQFARALTTNRSYLLGVVVPDLMHSYFAEICRGVEGLARPLGYQNLICSTDEQSANEQHEVEVLLPRTDGLIIASSVPPDENVFYRRIIKDGAKIILIDRRLEGVRCPPSEGWTLAGHRRLNRCPAFRRLPAGAGEESNSFRRFAGARVRLHRARGLRVNEWLA